MREKLPPWLVLLIVLLAVGLLVVGILLLPFVVLQLEKHRLGH